MNLIRSIIDKLVNLIGKIHWRARDVISDADKAKIMQMLKEDYYIICTRRNNHLSTFFIGLANLFLSGRWGYYSHVLMNLEDEANDPEDFRLVEAVGTGVQWSTFDQVFGEVSSVCLLKPRSMTVEDWTAVLDKAKTEIGKPYDTLFDLKNDSAVSCVELVRACLAAEPDYYTNFAEFERMISKSRNLVPQMFRDCADFEAVLEIKG